MGDYFDRDEFSKDLAFDFDNPDNGDDITGIGDNAEDDLNFGAQHVIALIDCNPDMFEKVPPRPKVREGESNEEEKRIGDGNINIGVSSEHGDSATPTAPFDMSIQTMQKLVETVIETTVTRKTGKRDAVGILLYDTKSRKKGKQESNGNEPTEGMEEEVDDDDKMDENESGQEAGEHDEEDDSNDGGEVEATSYKTNVHKLLDLAPPGIKQFRVLRQLVSSKNGQDSKSEFCSEGNNNDPRQAPLQNAIEEAMRMFLNSKYVRDRNKAKKPEEIDSRTIWIFTNQTNPYSTSLQQLIENVANEAKEQHVEFVVWPLASIANGNLKAGTFVSPFFGSLASAWLFDKRFQDFDELEQEGLYVLYQKMKKNRRVYHGPMHILRSSSSRDAPIMVDWFSPLQLSKRPSKVQIDDETKLETNRIRIFSTNDGEKFASFHANPNVEQREIQMNQPGLSRFRSFYYFVDELIPMQKQDINDMLKFANGGYEPGLTILGFKPRGSIPIYHSIHSPLIVYPNDKEVQGSSAAFAQLHAAMVRKHVLAIGEVQHREQWQSRLVAIIPLSKSPSDEDTDKPAGMMVFKLPFEDDIRSLAPDEASKELECMKSAKRRPPIISVVKSDVGMEPELLSSTAGITEEVNSLLDNVAPDDLVSAAMKMVARLTVNKEADIVNVQNDAMDDFYSYLKSVALDVPRERIDRGEKINSSMLSSKARIAIQKFHSMLPLDIPTEKRSSGGRKRTKDLPPDNTGIDWKTLYQTKKLSSCKNDELKECLRSLGEKVSGNKGELVDRLMEGLHKKFAETENFKKEEI